MNQQLTALAEELERDQEVLQRELEEIELLLRQAASEVERNEARRVQAEERLNQVERDATPPPEAVVEARAQVLNQTRRTTLMQAQLDVLGGKQRALQRYRERVQTTLPVVRSVALVASEADGPPTAAASASGDVLAAQEQMRGEIARQMHDGPAQSIANIALQAQIVERIFERDPDRASQELKALVAMVQQALDATKAFIFDVRPMVLDDLGLVPTLRRSAAERSRRSGVPVRFESAGTDRRLSTETESGLFRMIDDAVAGYLGVGASSVIVRLDWAERRVRATIRAASPTTSQTDEQRARASVAAARRDKALPEQLATMIHQQEEDEAARNAGLPDDVQAELTQRALPLGITVELSEDGWEVALVVAR